MKIITKKRWKEIEDEEEMKLKRKQTETITYFREAFHKLFNKRVRLDKVSLFLSEEKYFEFRGILEMNGRQMIDKLDGIKIKLDRKILDGWYIK